MKKTILSILSLSMAGLTFAADTTGEVKTSATMEASCLISTSPIGFGAVSTPLLSQSASNDMIVRCSNNLPYSIHLTYGGTYGYTYKSAIQTSYKSTNGTSNTYNVYLGGDTAVGGTMQCGFSNAIRGQVFFSSVTIANLYGYQNSGWNVDTTGSKGPACVYSGTPTAPGNTPSGWVGNFNIAGKQTPPDFAFDYGVMKGLSKGDLLAYSIQVPGEPTKSWNTEKNTYQAIGTGENQTIPMNAKIAPDKSSSKFVAPDMYLDTVNAFINY